MIKSGKSHDAFTATFLNLILLIQAIMVIYPIAFTISSAFSKSNSLSSSALVPFIYPKNPSGESMGPSLYQFKRLFTESMYGYWYLNTLKIAVMNTLITVFVCSTAGYIFSRFKFPLKKPIMASMIILQMFPSFIGMVATYVILMRINALNTHWGLVLVYTTGSIPYNTWLMKGYYDTVSKDIAEAAYVDGCTPFSTYIRIIIPTVKPQLIFLTLTSFTGPWMDFIFPKLILRSEDKKTLAVGLYEMINGRSADKFTMFAAGALLVAVPFIIIFMAGQKQLLVSLAGTSGKE